MNSWLQRRPRLLTDDGVALLTVIMILGLVGALSLTLAVVTTNNLVSARLAQQAGASVNASDAGVSQAVTYLRENGVRSLNQCSPTCTGNPWGNKDNPAVVTIGGRAGQSYRVWIEPISKFPVNRPGVYRIHSTGIAGGPAGRSVTVDAAIDLTRFPLGIATNATVGGGNVTATRISLFASGCVYRRDKIVFEGIDQAYGIPAAAHSARTITTSQGSGKECPGTSRPIHDTTKPAPQPACNTAYPFDQDQDGSTLAGTSCENLAASRFPSEPQFTNPSHPAYQYPRTSYVDDSELFNTYGVRRPPLTQSQLEYLKSVATSQGNYWTASSGWTVPTNDHAVVYFDLTAAGTNRTVRLNDFLPAWQRPANLTDGDSQCPNRSLLILVEGGDAQLNGSTNLAASVFLLSDDPYGNMYKANGTAQFTGTVYANNLDFTGTADMALDACFMANISPLLTTVTNFNYREVDR